MIEGADVCVIGLGAMGLATMAELAARGVSVIGVEQFGFSARGRPADRLEQVPLFHDRGSSHGHSRIIRTAYYEDPVYVPLCRRAFEKWRQLEESSGETLLVPSPCLSIGDADGEMITGVKRSAAEHGLAIEELSASEIVKRYPAFRNLDGYRGVLEHDAGMLRVEACLRAMWDAAVTKRVSIRDHTTVTGWGSITDSGFLIGVSDRRSALCADTIIVTAGPWATTLLKDIGVPLSVMRQTVHWFTEPADVPIFLLDAPGAANYGLPAFDGRGVKVARHYGAPELPSPDTIDRTITNADTDPILEFTSKHLPALKTISSSSTCIYTLTPDRHFVIDRHPTRPNVIVAAGFSGHGFKFAPVVGELLADLAMNRPPAFDLTPFSARRAISQVV